MTLDKIKRKIQTWRPSNVHTLLESCGFPLRYLGDGAYRKVYEIVGSGYVVKLSLSKPDILHSQSEYRTWNKFRRSKKYAQLHPYLPEEVYLHKETGTVVMTKYAEPAEGYEKEMDRVAELVKFVTRGYNDKDISSDKWDNWGLDSSGNLRILDLALLEDCE